MTSSYKRYKLVIDGKEVYEGEGFIDNLQIVWEDAEGKKSRIAYED